MIFSKYSFSQQQLAGTNQIPILQILKNKTFNCHHAGDLKSFSQPRLILRHLHDLKSKYSFQNSVNPYCSYEKTQLKFAAFISSTVPITPILLKWN